MESARHSIGGQGPRRPPIPSAPIDTDGVLVCLVSDRLFLFLSIRSVRPSGLASLSAGIHIINIIARRDMMKGVTTAARGAHPPTHRLFVGLPFPSAPPLRLAKADNERERGPTRDPSASVARPRARARTPCYPSGTTKRPTEEEKRGNGSRRTDGWGCLFQLIPP